MNTRTIIGRALTATAIAATAALSLTATPATAAPAVAGLQGPAGYITFWDGCNTGNTAGYCGAAWPIPQTVTLNTCYAVPSGSNDKFSAFSNNTSHNYQVYTAGSCGGSSATLYAGTETGQLAGTFNNTISSYVRRS